MLFGLPLYLGSWLVLRITQFFTTNMPNLMINSIALSLMIASIAVIIIHYPFEDIFSNRSTQKYKQSPMEEEHTKQIVELLREQLTKDDLFKDNSLNLTKLSHLSGFSLQQISQALSSQGTTFNDQINEFRLAHVKNRLREGDGIDVDILQLAMDSGFNSKATFYRVFKEREGMTPSQYRKGLAKP